MTRPFGIAVIGAGMAALPHARALNDLIRDGRVAVRGVHTRSAKSRAAFCAEHGFTPADSTEALANDPEVDALLLLTPPHVRIAPVRLFAEAGKHILCEKPIGRTVADAEEVVRICDGAGVRLGCVFQHRYGSGSQQLRAMLDDDAFGRIELVRCDVPWWRPQSYYDEPGRGTMARDGGGVLMSQAIHTLDLMLSMTGPVTAVQALTATTGLHSMECEDFAAGGLRFASGAVGSVVATTAAYPGGAEALHLHCENASVTLQRGALEIQWLDGRTETIGETAATGGGADPMAFPHGWHRDLIAGFAEAVQAGRDPVPSGRDALAAQRLIDAMIQSSAQGRFMEVAQ